MLIATRALLGIAGATLMPSTLALISNMFRNPKQRAIAIGLWMSCFMAGVAVGPVVGGLLLEYFWWGSVFLLGVPVMVLLLIAAPMLLPEYRDPNAGRVDLTSVALSLAAILPIIYGLKELVNDGQNLLPSLSVITGFIFGAVFIYRQRALAHPLLDLRLFGNRSFSAALVIMLFGTTLSGGIILLVTQYLQLVEGLSPLQAGIWMVPSAFGIIAGNMLAPAIASKIRPGNAVAAGLAIAACGFLLLTQVDSSTGLLILVAGYVIALFGIGPLGVLCTDLVVGSAPPEKAGSASAVSETSGELGMALGVAVVGSAGTVVYRNQMTGVLPAEASAEVTEAARDSLAGAVSAAEALPDHLAGALLNPAREAFTSGLNIVAGASAVTVVVLAVLAILLLRQLRPGDEGINETGGHQ